MAPSLQTLILLIILLLSVAAAQRPDRRVSFNYDFNSRRRPRGLTYQGDAHFPTETTTLRLTKTDVSGNIAQPNSLGRVLYSRPVIFLRRQRQASFETTVRFIIKPNTGDNNPADGLVFFIAPVNSTIGAGGGNLGVFDVTGNNPSVFAVEFDIFSNEFDPSYRHVGIDIQSRISRNVTEVDDAILGQQVTANITYDATRKLISVRGSGGARTFELSYVFDLSTILPQQVQVGISAATGSLVAIHDVVAWAFRTTFMRTEI